MNLGLVPREAQVLNRQVEPRKQCEHWLQARPHRSTQGETKSKRICDL